MSPIILLIEDDLMLRNYLCAMLEAEEFNVIGAEDGLVGLQLAKHLQPDLILCDINMPNMNGYGVQSKNPQGCKSKKYSFHFPNIGIGPGKSQSVDRFRRSGLCKQEGKLHEINAGDRPSARCSLLLIVHRSEKKGCHPKNN